MAQEQEPGLENRGSEQGFSWMNEPLAYGPPDMPQGPMEVADAAAEVTDSAADTGLDASDRPTLSTDIAAPAASVSEAPVSEEAPAHQPAVVCASNEADERVGLDIGNMLATSKMLEGRHLLVEVVDGEVFLHGTVADQAVKTLVELLSSSVEGAKRIHNELDVRS